MKFTVDSIREDFPGLNNMTYLNSATLGLMAGHTGDAVKSALDCFIQGPGEQGASCFWSSLDAPLTSARTRCARLIGALAEDIAFIQDTSSGLNLALLSIPFRPGANIVFSDLEYPQIGLSAQHIHRLKGVEIRIVPHRNGELTVDDYLPFIDQHTQAIITSAVHWVNGKRMNIARFSELARKIDSYLVVDAVQQMGVAPFEKCEVDFLISGTHKWLNAPFNLGFMYINPKRREQLNPPDCFALSALAEPSAGWSEYMKNQTITSFTDCSLSTRANRFETNSVPKWIAGAGLDASLAYYEKLDRDGATRHILDLGAWFIEELNRRGCMVWTPAPSSQRAGIVSFMPVLKEPASIYDLSRIYDENRIYLSTRFSGAIGGIRVSIHYFTNKADLEAVLACLDDFGG